MAAPPNAPAQGSAKLVIVSLGLALFAVIVTNFYIEMVRQQRIAATFPVYVLRTPVGPGDTIRMNEVETISVPDTEKFRRAFDSLGAMDASGLRLRVDQKEKIARSAAAGELLTYRLFTSDEGTNLDTLIMRGMRAVPLAINSRSVPGPLRVGMYVDLEATFQTDKGMEILPVMERVKVFSLGNVSMYESSGYGGRPTNYSSITVEITPEQATQLARIQKAMIGDFDIILRNPTDMATPKIPEGGINPVVLDLTDRRLRSTTGERRR